MIKFGTDGWRAIIGEELTEENIQKLALAMCPKAKEEGVKNQGTVTGYDGRLFSKKAVIWPCGISGDQGIRVWLANRSSPTPLVMFYMMKRELNYGMMMITSHNLAICNGIKMFVYRGRNANERQTVEIEYYLEQAEKLYEPDEEGSGRMPPTSYLEPVKRGMVRKINSMNEYLDNIISVINMDAIKECDLRVAIDPMYGANLTAPSTILSAVRCTIETINSRYDTLFGRKVPVPTERTLRNLQNYALDRYCDIGMAMDGDADGLGVIDDQGYYLHASSILVMLYYYLLKYKGWWGPAVRNLATTYVLDKVVESSGQKCYEVPVGFKHVSAKTQETDATTGGESSGGLAVKEHIHGKDGIYTAALLVEVIVVSDEKLSEITADIRKEYGTIRMVERDYRFMSEEKERIHNTLMEKRELPKMSFETNHIFHMDGHEVYLKNGGWVTVRFSGTEPLFRIFYEVEYEPDMVGVCNLSEEYLGLQETDQTTEVAIWGRSEEIFKPGLMESNVKRFKYYCMMEAVVSLV